MHNKDNDIDILNELILENENNTVELLESTEIFLEKISGKPNTQKIFNTELSEINLQQENQNLARELEELKLHFAGKPNYNNSILDGSGTHDFYHKKDSVASQISVSGDLVSKIRTLEKEIDEVKYENHLLRNSPQSQQGYQKLKDDIQYLESSLENTHYGFQKLMKSA